MASRRKHKVEEEADQIDTEQLDSALDVYTFRFLSDDTEKLIRRVWRDEGLRNEIEESLRLVVPWDTLDHHSMTEVIDNQKNRLPVYMGQPKWSMFKRNAQFRRNWIPTPPTLRAGVRGLAVYRKPNFPGEDPERSFRLGKFQLLHTWGINLESDQTQDFAHFVDPHTLKVKAKEFLATMKVVARIITHSSEDKIWMPLLGGGAFLTGLLSEAERHTAQKLIIQALASQVLPHQELVVVIKDTSLAKRVASYVPKNKRNRIQVIKGDFFRPIDHYGSDLSSVTMVDAADPESRIGNGGAQDNSIEGWLISGGGAGSPFINTSFLVNPIVFPSLLSDSTKWSEI